CSSRARFSCSSGTSMGLDGHGGQPTHDVYRKADFLCMSPFMCIEIWFSLQVRSLRRGPTESRLRAGEVGRRSGGGGGCRGGWQGFQPVPDSHESSPTEAQQRRRTQL